MYTHAHTHTHIYINICHSVDGNPVEFGTQLVQMGIPKSTSWDENSNVNWLTSSLLGNSNVNGWDGNSHCYSNLN